MVTCALTTWHLVSIIEKFVMALIHLIHKEKKAMKKLLAAFLITILLLPACAPTVNCASKDVFCVGLVTDRGKINDKAFNQSAWEGLQRAQKELGAQVQYIET